MPGIVRSANSSQKGFIIDRHFTDNIVLVDTTMRMYSNLIQKYGQVIAAFFDFPNAFPSVALAWLFLVFDWLGMPEGLINFIHGIYHNVECFIKHCVQVEYMCKVGCGVLQGCPLASILFVMAIEPFSILLNAAVNLRGIVELCADDIAIVLQSWLDHPSVHKDFEFARRAANLHLKPRKCFLIPLSARLTSHLIEIIEDFLRAQIPCWIDFEISSHALYLGIWLGPTAGSMQWTSQINKYIERVNLISSSGISSALATKAYNLKVATTLTYPAQFLLPPPNLIRLEKYAFVKMYKVPYNTFAYHEQFTLQK